MNENVRGSNQESIQATNRELVLNLVRQKGICSRVVVAKETHLKQATITYITNDLIKLGLIREVGLIQGNKGRRSIGISIDETVYGVIAIRLARKNYEIGIANLAGKIEHKKNYSTKNMSSPQDILNCICQSVYALLQKNEGKKILAIGISVPGPFNSKEKKIALMTGTMGWENISLEKELFYEFKIPVLLEQDANAGALTQLWFSDKDYSSGVLMYVSAGQGIGAGILVNGKILQGSIGIAGEIGHTTIDYRGPKCACGNRGCLEKYCSTISLLAAVNETGNSGQEYSLDDIKKLVREKDEYCLNKYLECCDYMAVGIVNIMNSFNPDVIVLGDELVSIEPEIFIKRVREKVQGCVLPEVWENTLIVKSTIEEDVELYGAAITAIRDIYQRSSEYLDRIK